LIQSGCQYIPEKSIAQDGTVYNLYNCPDHSATSGSYGVMWYCLSSPVRVESPSGQIISKGECFSEPGGQKVAIYEPPGQLPENGQSPGSAREVVVTKIPESASSGSQDQSDDQQQSQSDDQQQSDEQAQAEENNASEQSPKDDKDANPEQGYGCSARP